MRAARSWRNQYASGVSSVIVVPSSALESMNLGLIGATLAVVILSKFFEGAWITLLLIPGLLAMNIMGSGIWSIAFSIVTSIWTALKDVQPWIDLGTSQTPLFSGDAMTGKEWAQLAVGTLIWVVLPFLAGLWRVLRAELK